MKHSHFFITSFLLFVILPIPAWAACSGTSPNLVAPSWADVTACHRIASDGDTITVASGNYTVTGNTAISKYVKIVASGTVTLTDNICIGHCNNISLIDITESPAGSTWFQGFTIESGTSIHDAPASILTMNQTAIPDTGKPIVVYGNTYDANNGFASGDFIRAATNRGVISHNKMIGDPHGAGCSSGSNGFVRNKMATFGPGWSSPAYWGAADTNGDQNLYIEDNVTINVQENFLDTDDYGRTVVRYNSITNGGIAAHGTDTSGTGGRLMDIYNNTWIRDVSLQPDCNGGTLIVNENSFIAVRGGTALIHNNIIPDLKDGYWGDKSEILLLVENLDRNSGPYGCWSTLTQPGAGYPFPHQTGWGYTAGGTRPGTTGVSQDSEPIYIWGNTGAGNYNSPSIGVSGYADCPASPNTPPASAYLQLNRDYFLNTAKPGYVPYTYPHPLVMGIRNGPVVTISIK